ncbi:hypothetical protein AB0L70_40965 [Kribbella sp. NPDC051952]|uniref:hypothetical protein n=1 Tax=Kribbella sp. NPDC051952 TaxID=3154851 RepID=UPI0034281B89
MRGRSVAAALLATGMLAPLPAHAQSTSPAKATAACNLSLGSVNAGGDHTSQGITAGTPPKATAKGIEAADRFAPGATRLHSTWTIEPEVPADWAHYGEVVLGSSMYQASYRTGAVESDAVTFHRIGGGWDQFSYFEESVYDEGAHAGSVAHTHYYGLRNDGTLFRWRQDNGWKAAGSYPGFSAVKTMALISQTRTYDTFLATTKGGALYTIRIPISSPMKPIVKQVRSRTWQGAEQLIAERCGQYGVLLLGIDKDTKSGYLYAVGHANGASTVINSLGKVPTTFDDPTYFRWTAVAFANPPLNGE